jgi:hypothetical protein
VIFIAYTFKCCKKSRFASHENNCGKARLPMNITACITSAGEPYFVIMCPMINTVKYFVETGDTANASAVSNKCINYDDQKLFTKVTF